MNLTWTTVFCRFQVQCIYMEARLTTCKILFSLVMPSNTSMTVTPDLSSYLLGSQLNITCRSDSFFSTGTPLRFRWTRDRQRINDGITEVLEPGLYRGQKLTSVYTSTVAIAHDNTVVQCVPDFDNFLISSLRLERAISVYGTYKTGNRWSMIII